MRVGEEGTVLAPPAFSSREHRFGDDRLKITDVL